MAPLGLLALLLAALAVQQVQSDGPITSAKFVTCPGCRLNRLHDVRKFIRGEVEQGHYPGITVEFIPGRSPEVYFYDASGKEVEKMYVDKLSFTDLETLVTSKGFKHDDKPPQRTATQSSLSHQ